LWVAPFVLVKSAEINEQAVYLLLRDSASVVSNFDFKFDILSLIPPFFIVWYVLWKRPSAEIFLKLKPLKLFASLHRIPGRQARQLDDNNLRFKELQANADLAVFFTEF
jgi:hypothetical protein